ncbi:MAG: hypothetical protein HYX39_12225 [Bacteroidetes bacterium]|nr:hypothetical protein [Bacteroidota bacterium]
MSSNEHFASGTLLCTVTGTALSMAAHLDSPDVVNTMLLAALGAVVSFTVSVTLKWLVKKCTRLNCPDKGIRKPKPPAAGTYR